ncbi:gastrula zinc finger protein XlCGF57.1-like [Erpetoichthys calabaricus]|uniref:gastrula zinc finger protein XlCGF57.1-like n=1 Tax=Erpetoichthys calabaricus TaxID=27687 RepID=UPI002233E477|nr:gastrula zinc finger protein XlCGF57.1-like [Erpetoichthys calabaricus]
MEKAYSAVEGPQHVKYKCEERVSEEVCEDEQETYYKMHGGLLLIHGIEVDKERCKWSSGHLEHENICMNKQEDCDGPMDFTVDSELLPSITDVQKNKSVNSIKEEDLNCESDWQCSDPEEEGPGLGLTPSRHCPLQQHSVHVKRESLESDIKWKAKASDSSPSEEALPANGSFFLSPLAQTSPQYRPQLKMEDKNMKNLTLASENGIPGSLQDDSQPVKKLNTVGVITTQTQIANTELTTVHQTSREKIESKCKSRDSNLCQTQQEPCGCSDCFKMFRQMSHLKKHRILQTGEKPFSCPECGKAYTTTGSLRRHVKIHTGEKPYCCSDCGKRFTQPHSLKNHRRIHTGEKPYCCFECGKQFTYKSSLLDHTRTHTGEKPYSCSECGKQFRQIGYLLQHRRIHGVEKPHCCSNCGKQFKVLRNLKAHKRIHTGQKPYCCSDCGKRFTEPHSLKNHRRIHTGEKPYCCPECGRGFTCAGSLQSHIKIHTGEKPYCCSECGKRFRQNGHLHVHRRIHTGEKPYCCSDCGKQFKRPCSLKIHSRTHTREKAQ